MKKIIIGYILFFAVLFAVFFGNKLYLLQGNNVYKYKSDTGIAYVAKTQGKDFFVYNGHGAWDKLFVAGVNIGAAKPGSYPGEFAITKQDYLRWFQYIHDMNANTIRVYTKQMPSFYEALNEFNISAENPLYLMQGVYVNEDDIAKYQDVFAQNGKIKNEFYGDIKQTIDVIHGNTRIEKVEGVAGGTYTVDVSRYVSGWILGIEWDPAFVITTNERNPSSANYDGQYVATKDSSPFEAFLAQAADTAISYETAQYNEQRPVSLCNWVTTDPLSHPNEPYPNEDAVSVDAEHIVAKSNFEAGFFASYHVYPYYPDLFSYETKYLADGKGDTYAAYLKELNAYHTMPLLVAEVGIPASRGITHKNVVSGFNQGHIEETEQGKILTSLFGDIQREQCMGALVFSWDDEWFKTTWNTMDLDIADRRAYWLDYQTSEQNFGLLAFDPGKETSAATVDGNVSEWDDSSIISQNGDTRLYAKSDEEFLYLKADVSDFQNSTYYIPIDTIPGQGNTAYHGIKFDSAADFLLVLSGKDNSTLLVDPYYDVTYYQYAVMDGMLIRDPGKEKTDTGEFTQITQVLSRQLHLPLTGQTIPFSTFDTGKLKYGNADPDSPDYDSLADFCWGNGSVEIRIPWLILNVMDPSSKKIIGNMYQNKGIAAQDGNAFSIGIVPSNGNTAAMGTYRWEKWQMPPYHERLKKSYYVMKDTFASMVSAAVPARTPFEVFWAQWNETAFSKIATWFPIQPVLNYLIAFLLSIIFYFFIVLLYIHTVTSARERSKNKIRTRIQKKLGFGKAQRRSFSINTRKLFSRSGLGILNDLFISGNEQDQDTLRDIFCNRGYYRNLESKLKTRNAQDLILVIRVIGELKLKELGNEIVKLLYTWKNNLDLQYQGFLTLALLASRDDIVNICMDNTFVHTLSFRSLQEVLKAYAGDKLDLYKTLLSSPDRFIKRICIKRIGTENFTELAEDICPYLDSGDYNTVIDASRALGQLKYQSAAPKLIALLSHERWEVRCIAASALGSIDVERYADVLAGALHDREWQVRFNAAKVLRVYSRIESLLVNVKESADKYAFEILDYMTRDRQMQEVKE